MRRGGGGSGRWAWCCAHAIRSGRWWRRRLRGSAFRRGATSSILWPRIRPLPMWRGWFGQCSKAGITRLWSGCCVCRSRGWERRRREIASTSSCVKGYRDAGCR